MLASTLGPVASAFSLCALVRPWRQYYPPGTNIDDALYLPDPTWYIFPILLPLLASPRG